MSRPEFGMGSMRGRRADSNGSAQFAMPFLREKKFISRSISNRASSRVWFWSAIGGLVFAEVLLLGGHAVRWAMTSTRFVLGEVKIAGHMRLSPESLIKLSALRPGTNLFGVDLENIRRRIETNPWVRKSSIRISPPSTLRIEIEERKPVVLVDRKNAVAVDEEGVILGPVPDLSNRCLPLLEGIYKKNGRPGDRINQRDFSFAYKAVSIFSGRSFGKGECLGTQPAKNGNLWIRSLGGKMNLLVSKKNIEAQAA